MLWQKTKEILAEKLPESAYSLWIDPLTASKSGNSNLQLTGPNNFFCSWVAEKYHHDIKDALAVLGYQDIEVSFQAAGGGEKQQPLLAAPREPMRLPNVPRVKTTLKTLHPRYTFDEFVVGNCNLMAHSACEAIAKDDTVISNCVYLKAGTGLGKSHLSHAVAHHIIDHNPSTRLNYLTAQQLTSEMVKNIKNNTMTHFKEKYHNQCDVLLIEDVHTLAGRTKTQEELGLAMDVLLESGKKIIFTGSMGPREIPNLESGIRSRLSSGLITAMNPPSLETRMQIVKRKASMHSLHLTEEIVGYIAENVKGDIRQMESIIVSLKAQAALLKTAPDFTMIKEALANVVGQAQQVSPVVVRDFIANQFKISVADMQSKSRKQLIAFPRQVAMYLSRKFTDASLVHIGSAFKRDHSTVVHAIRVITEKRTRNTAVRRQVDFLEDKLQKKFL